MDKDIGVGLLVGLLIATTIYVYNSVRFSNTQKIILYICIIFAPAQWLLILIFLAVNYTISENSKERKEEKAVKSETINYSNKLETLKDLHKQGILSDDEYYEKSAKLKSEILQSEIKQTPEYKKLKSLYDDGILTKEEFEAKTKNIKPSTNHVSNKTDHKESKGYDTPFYISIGLIVIAFSFIIYIYASKFL